MHKIYFNSRICRRIRYKRLTKPRNWNILLSERRYDTIWPNTFVVQAEQSACCVCVSTSGQQFSNQMTFYHVACWFAATRRSVPQCAAESRIMSHALRRKTTRGAVWFPWTVYTSELIRFYFFVFLYFHLLGVNEPLIVHSALVPSTHHSHHPSPLHSFTPGLKLSFSANPSHHTYHFFSWTDSTDSPDCLPILLSISVFSLYSSCTPLLVFLTPFLQILPTAPFPFSPSGFTIWISQTVYCYFWAYPSFLLFTFSVFTLF